MPALTANDLFSSRDTLEEALAYANSVIEALPLEYRMAVFTAVNVVSNTAIKLLAEKDLSTVQPFSEEELKALDGARIDTLPPYKLARLIRTEMATGSAIAFLLEQEQSPFATRIGSLFNALRALFQVPTDDYIQEMLPRVHEYRRFIKMLAIEELVKAIFKNPNSSNPPTEH